MMMLVCPDSMLQLFCQRYFVIDIDNPIIYPCTCISINSAEHGIVFHSFYALLFLTVFDLICAVNATSPVGF